MRIAARRVAPSRHRAAPTCTISIDAATGLYGFSWAFEGKPPHHAMAVFTSLDSCLEWCDPHGEMEWKTCEGNVLRIGQQRAKTAADHL